MTDYDSKRRCSACGEWSTPIFDIRVETERVQFAKTNVIPDPKEMLSQHIEQTSLAGLCRKCMVKELLHLQERPDHASIAVSWPSNGGPNA